MRKAISDVWRHKKKNGKIIMVEITADDIIYKDIPSRLILAHDVTEKMEMEEKQKKYTEELKSSNTELERFAYIASHDLQEPLRMVNALKYHGEKAPLIRYSSFLNVCIAKVNIPVQALAWPFANKSSKLIREQYGVNQNRERVAHFISAS